MRRWATEKHFVVARARRGTRSPGASSSARGRTLGQSGGEDPPHGGHESRAERSCAGRLLRRLPRVLAKPRRSRPRPASLRSSSIVCSGSHPLSRVLAADYDQHTDRVSCAASASVPHRWAASSSTPRRDLSCSCFLKRFGLVFLFWMACHAGGREFESRRPRHCWTGASPRTARRHHCAGPLRSTPGSARRAEYAVGPA